jgi:hypothetical protein
MLKNSKKAHYGDMFGEVLWVTGLILLPLTSFPLLSSLSGGLVAPLSIIPFLILLLFFTIPLVFRKGELPKETIPLLLFLCVAVISAAAAFFIFIPGFKGKYFPAQEIRALLTLLVGFTFYLVASSWVRTSQKLANTWKYITLGGILAVAWACLQSYFILRHADLYPSWMNHVQSWLAVLSPQYSPRYGRVNGLTYEASWFAHQMVMIYLPIWIASTYHNTSAFHMRVWRISVENILLVLGLGVFFLSSPRIGLLSFFLMLLFLFIKINMLLYRKVSTYLSTKLAFLNSISSNVRKNWIRLVTSMAIVSVYALIMLGVFYFAVQRDWRLSKLVSEPPSSKEIVGLLTLDENTLLTLSQRFIFLERMVYWLNGWNVFNQYPWLGVGLGNAGFFFPKLAPSMGWATFEIRNVLYYLTQLPNVKSFWFRLLAETGIIGFSVFITWIYMLFQSARVSTRSQDPAIKTMALAGQLAVLAFIGEGFSIDSFAMPYLWVMAGLVAALALIYRREVSRDGPP